MVLDSVNSLLIQSMCGDQEPIKSKPSSSSLFPKNLSLETMNRNGNNSHLVVEGEADGSFTSTLLELAANNDLDEFKQSLDRDPSAIDEIGLWYGRKKGCNQMVLQQRTALMVAATYGSLDVLNLILSVPGVDVNKCCGEDKTTALHCAAAGGSMNVVDAVKALLSAGADPNVEDANGLRPADVIVVSPRLVDLKVALEDLLGKSCVNGVNDSNNHPSLRVFTGKMNVNPNSFEDGNGSPISPMISTSSSLPEKKEYPIDPSLPDIKNSIYATDEFRMFSFKVRPCSRAYSHDWTECPFVHPGENARRRDPRKFHYSCVPCPDFRKGTCRRGDLCEYAHGVFECWLHPAQYRTRLCKDGTGCNRRVCFFAHTNEELRPLYLSTGSAVPSPRSSASAAMEMAVAMGFVPSSPSSVSSIMSPFAQPMSPSTLNWPQPNVPTLHLPGSNLQSSRLRASLNARNMPGDDYSLMQDFEAQQLMNDLCLSRLGSRGAARSKTLTPSNLDDLFSAEISSSSSPRYGSEQGAAMFSPSHKAAILNQFQQQQQSLLSPINTSHNALLQASIGISSPGRMSPRSMEPLSPMSARLSAIAQRERQQQSLRSLSSRDLGSNNPAIADSSLSSSWSKWASPSGTLDWGANGEELGRLKRSSSFDLRSGGEEPDLSWVHSLVKESPNDKPMAAVSTGANDEGSSSNTPTDSLEDQAAALGAWLEKMKMDRMVV